MRFIVGLIIMMFLFGCGPSLDEKARAQLVDTVRNYSESQVSNVERLNKLVMEINNILQEYKATSVAQAIVRGEPIILGKSLNVLKKELVREQNFVEYSKFLLALVTERCLKNITNLVELKSKLEKNESFQPIEDSEGSFETHYKNVNLGVTPETDRCTVDVMLQNEYHDVLFQINHIDKQLESISDHSDKTFIEDVDTGPDNNEVKVLKKEYQMKDGVILKLVYPVTGLDKFYMYVDVVPIAAHNE